MTSHSPCAGMGFPMGLQIPPTSKMCAAELFGTINDPSVDKWQQESKQS